MREKRKRGSASENRDDECLCEWHDCIPLLLQPLLLLLADEWRTGAGIFMSGM